MSYKLIPLERPDGINVTLPRDCPKGYYCLAGTKWATQYPCPPGTFNAKETLESATQCQPCTPGTHLCKYIYNFGVL